MRRTLPLSTLTASLLLAIAGSAASAQDTARVDPALRIAERLNRITPTVRPPTVAGPRPPAAADSTAFDRLAPFGARGAGRAAVPAAAALEPGPAGPVVRALVRVRNGADADVIERHGGHVGARAGDIVTARLPLDALTALAAEPMVEYIEAAVALHPDAGPVVAGGDGGETLGAVGSASGIDLANDRGRAETGVDGLRRRVGDAFLGLAGQEVVIGVYDTGIDLEHEDFDGPDGRTRIRYAWDQSASTGRPPGALGPHSFDYGDECDATRIDAGECGMVDRNGHGTHVAGTAAGDGSATGSGQPAYRYAGMAPAAELIVVKGGDGSYAADRVVDGVAYIFERARELGRPAVVNLSLGTQEGAHDGSLTFERALDALAGPGRILVASAGNQGTNANESPAFARAPAHAEGERSGEHTLIVPEYSPGDGVVDDAAYLELWYDGADSLDLAVVSPGGETVAAATGDTALVETADGGVLVWNALDGRNPGNGLHQASILIFDADASSPPSPGEWTIRISGRAIHAGGSYHLWMAASNLVAGTALTRLSGGTTNRYLVTAPATADSVLAVAAYATRFDWATADDSVDFPYREPLGDIASFSSPGPRRDEVLKPLIAAPGKLIISSLAPDAELWEDGATLVERDGRHGALLGTSVAAPFVTGAVALLLQIDGELSPGNARDILSRSARHDAFTSHPYTGRPDGTPNAQWGWGKLDIASAARRMRPRGIVRAGERVNLSENPVRGDRLLINYGERPERIALFTVGGEPVRRWTADGIGDWLTAWDLRNGTGGRVANGAYLLVLEFPDDRITRKIFVLRP